MNFRKCIFLFLITDFLSEIFVSLQKGNLFLVEDGKLFNFILPKLVPAQYLAIDPMILLVIGIEQVQRN